MSNERIADTATGVSWVGFLASVASDWLPIIQALSGICAIIASGFAVHYYWRRLNRA